MINLRKINKKIFIIISILLIISICSKKTISKENKIIFKINETAYTSYDYEKRIKYLDFIGENNNLDKDLIINDLISVSIFLEYYKNENNQINYEKEIENIFFKIKNINDQNNKKYKFEIDKANILYNIKVDLLRKKILEKLLREKINNLEISNEILDLLYKFDITYINFESIINDEIKILINDLNQVKLNNILSILDKNKIKFFIKNQEINNINKIDSKLRKNILSNNNFFIIDGKKNQMSLVFIEKRFETFEGIIANIYSVRSQDELSDKFLKCQNLKKIKDIEKIENKEYNFKDLNNDLKENLININDFVKYSNANENIYIILCDIKFNQEILNNINYNKLINLNVREIEKEFISKYSKIYNLIKLYV